MKKIKEILRESAAIETEVFYAYKKLLILKIKASGYLYQLNSRTNKLHKLVIAG